FRTPAANAARARVVWADMGRTPRALLLAAGDQTVPLNSCYVVPCDDHDDALALTALLNSSLAAAWLHVLAGIEIREIALPPLPHKGSRVLHRRSTWSSSRRRLAEEAIALPPPRTSR